MITIKNLSKIYRSNRRRVDALRDVSLSFPSKGMFFLLGESGAGKSTLLKILSLQELPTNGQVYFEGKMTSKMKSKERAALRASYLAIIAQDLDMIDGLTVEENLSIAREASGGKVEEQELLSLLERLSLPLELRKEKPENLSGGQRQRVAIGRAMLKDSKVYLCDEPTGNLDEANAESVMNLLKALSEERLVIVVSHNTHLAETYADGIVRLQGGLVVSSTLPEADEIPADEPKVCKTSLRFPTEAKLSFSTLKPAAKKLALTGVSTILASAFILSLFSFLEFNMERAFQNALDDEEVPMVTIKKHVRIREHYSEYSDFSQKECEEAQKFFPVSAPRYSYRGELVFITGAHPDGYPQTARQQYPEICDMSTLPLEEFGFELRGRLPEPGEIVLSFYQMITMGLLPKNAAWSDATLEAIPGGKAAFYDGFENIGFEYKVVGIINTNYPYFANPPSNNPYKQKEPDLARANELHGFCGVNHEDYGYFQERHKEFLGPDAIQYHGLCVPRRYATLKDVQRYSDYLRANNPAESAKLLTRLDACFSALQETKNNWGRLLEIGSMVLALFAIFSFASFLFAVLENGRATWAILNNLGAKKWNLFSILFLQSTWIALATVLVALIPYACVLLGVNMSTNNALGAAFSPLSFSAAGPFAALGALLGLGALLSVIGVWRISRQSKPKKKE